MRQAADGVPALNCDLDIKQAAAVTLNQLKLSAVCFNLGQTAAVNNSESLSFLLSEISAGWR